MFKDGHFYHQSIRKTVAVFGTLFNNLRVVRRDSSGKVLNIERVPLAYGPKQKFLSRIEQANLIDDPKVAIKLPRMAFEITSLTYDAETKMQKMHIERHAAQRDIYKSGIKDYYIGPVMYNMGIQLSIIAKNQDDALQILEQILPYFQPQYTVTVKEIGDYEKSDYPFSLVGVDMSDDYEGDYTTRRALIYTLDFTTKVRFYGPVEERPVIKKIWANTYAVTNEQDEFGNAILTIIDPFDSNEEDNPAIIQKIFVPDYPNSYTLYVNDTSRMSLGDFVNGDTNGATAMIAGINDNVSIDVVNSDGPFEIGENLNLIDKQTVVMIEGIDEVWT